MSKFSIHPTGSGNISVGDNMTVNINSGERNAGSHQPSGSNLPTSLQTSEVLPSPTQETEDINELNYKIKQGHALIIHNCYFPKREDSELVGSKKDVKAIEDFCRDAGFFARDLEENKTAEEIKNLCSERARWDFDRYDAFACFILSHGSENGIYGVDDNTVSVQEIVTMFKECRTLTDKPKLFFIQACRGKNQDDGAVTEASDTTETADPLRQPTESDILIAHSTSEGYVSYIDREDGSWFIVTLISALKKYAHQMHLMDILTVVNNSMSKHERRGGKKQMPCQTSTLTKFVRFNYPPPLNS